MKTKIIVDKKAKEDSKIIALEKRVRDLENRSRAAWSLWIPMFLLSANVVLIWITLSNHSENIIGLMQ